MDAKMNVMINIYIFQIINIQFQIDSEESVPMLIRLDYKNLKMLYYILLFIYSLSYCLIYYVYISYSDSITLIKNMKAQNKL